MCQKTLLCGTTRELELHGHAEQNFLTTENESTQILDKIF
jgi:hypothetical protein